jgi:homoserine dehydrogenase
MATAALTAAELAAPLQPRPTNARTVRLALAGCGVVGSELVRLLGRYSAPIQQQYGVRFELARVLIRDTGKQRDVETPRHLFTADLDSFLDTPADVVVEAIGGLQPALRIAESAVRRGARFITANKALIAAHGHELHGSAGVSSEIQFEAAVGASVPVIRVLRDAVRTARPRAIRGILNGTSNFVLTLLEQGASLPDAIDEARRRGLAEADYSRDLDGRDVEDKIAILTWLAHGIPPQHQHITRSGLLPNIERLVADARAIDARVRLIGECIADTSGVLVNVEPIIVRADSAFGRTTHENNLITLDFGWKTPIELSGPGAGGQPTASALLSDLLDESRPLSVPPQTHACPADPRAHRWSISLHGNERAAFELASAADPDSAIVQLRHDALCFHTGPLTRSELAQLLAKLEQSGARPVAARLELHGAAQ